MSTTVLLASSEAASSILLERRLRANGFEIAEPGGHADVVLAADGPELERLCAEAPVIVLGSADDEPDDRVHAFRRGCDDYVPRPFDHEELVERIRAVLRRQQRTDRGTIEAGPLRIDQSSCTAKLGGVALRLAPKELALLAVLASEPERVFTKSELLRRVWDWRSPLPTRTVDSHASRLRAKLRAVDPESGYVDNVWGVGYRLRDPFPGGLL